MKNVASVAVPARRSFLFLFFRLTGLIALCCSFTIFSSAQAVTEIITDYNGFWKSSSASLNPVKPDNAHNLLAFTYNGTRYSTGVNDNLLAAQNVVFQQADFWSLPVSGMSGTITSNTKVGLGALYDGVPSGASNPAPEWGISTYLTDGTKGLGLGTCIANLPVGFMSFTIDNIQPGAIGDGIPDILVTQVADPSGTSYDRYEFTDINGVRVGSYKDIVFTNISPVGTWTVDFYEAVNNPLTLQAGFTQTDRPLRLWAADLSELGITTSNYGQIENFRINLCGNSDVAFVAYNSSSIDFNSVLPVRYNYLKATANEKTVVLSWQTASEQEADKFIVERSENGNNFSSIGSVAAKPQPNAGSHYFFVDNAPLQGVAYYRLKQLDQRGGFNYSRIIRIDRASVNKLNIRIYPNPAHDRITVQHQAASGLEKMKVYNLAGGLVMQQPVLKNSQHTSISIAHLPAGNYFVSLVTETLTAIAPFVIR